jgi:hypothetical protein
MRAYKDARYAERRAQLITGLGGFCWGCGDTHNLEIHHKIGLRELGLHYATRRKDTWADLSNLVLLCDICHEGIEGKRSGKYHWMCPVCRKRLVLRLAPERHLFHHLTRRYGAQDAKRLRWTVIPDWRRVMKWTCPVCRNRFTFRLRPSTHMRGHIRQKYGKDETLRTLWLTADFNPFWYLEAVPTQILAH